MIRGFLILLVFWSFTSQALETDQYMTWGLELKDSTQAVNTWVNERLQKRLLRRKVQKKTTCSAASEVLLKTFRRPFFQIIEGWAQNSPEVEVWPPRFEKRKYRRMSIFAKNIFPFIMPMAFSMNVNGVYFGTDKLGHFTSFGLRYANVYRKWRKRGLDKEAAMLKAVKYGLMSEVNLVGKYVTGVISFGDLEANFQGLRLVLSLCDKDSNFHFVPKKDGGWEFSGAFDIREWVNPGWDESYNENGYRKDRWNGKKGLKNRLNEYCSAREDISVKTRFSYYKNSFEKSLSQKYIDKLESTGELKHRLKYNFRAACSKPLVGSL